MNVGANVINHIYITKAVDSTNLNVIQVNALTKKPS